MQEDFLFMPADGWLSPGTWRAMGHDVIACPNCEKLVSYPINTTMYSVVCVCGWFTLPNDDGGVYWLAPELVRDVNKLSYESLNCQN